MQLTLIKENPDGSADYHIDLTAQEQNDLMRCGLILLLQKAIEEGKKYDPASIEGEPSVGDANGGEHGGVYGSGEQPVQSTQSSDSFKTSQVLG